MTNYRILRNTPPRQKKKPRLALKSFVLSLLTFSCSDQPSPTVGMSPSQSLIEPDDGLGSPMPSIPPSISPRPIPHISVYPSPADTFSLEHLASQQSALLSMVERLSRNISSLGHASAPSSPSLTAEAHPTTFKTAQDPRLAASPVPAVPVSAFMPASAIPAHLNLSLSGNRPAVSLTRLVLSHTSNELSYRSTSMVIGRTSGCPENPMWMSSLLACIHTY